jgi:hypothetical protein
MNFTVFFIQFCFYLFLNIISALVRKCSLSLGEGRGRKAPVTRLNMPGKESVRPSMYAFWYTMPDLAIMDRLLLGCEAMYRLRSTECRPSTLHQENLINFKGEHVMLKLGDDFKIE